ncbi:venom protein 302-like [Centruroides sculpturatus]|uniref:venom protein 302-like n=1 Tax=Centruroides sculpturatus TaxID=218467 RepID=UPI000C6CD8BB|nr:venom protein 302-like [Centruroides sculpturatus]
MLTEINVTFASFLHLTVEIKMLRFVILLSLIGSLYALSCPCWEWTEKQLKEYCPDISTCPLGLTLDSCGCCQECEKALGEVCGGPWFTSGKCGAGLRCQTDDGNEVSDEDYPGTLDSGTCVRDTD